MNKIDDTYYDEGFITKSIEEVESSLKKLKKDMEIVKDLDNYQRRIMRYNDKNKGSKKNSRRLS